MTTADVFRVDKPEVQALLDVLEQRGQVVSVFLKPKPSAIPDFSRERGHPLAELVAHPSFHQACADLGAVSEDLGHYSTLNRLEFEGSLISVVIAGGCHRVTSGVSPEVARSLVGNALTAAFPEPFADLHVFRLDEERWCQLTSNATISSSYFAWQSARGLWWVLCVADSD